MVARAEHLSYHNQGESSALMGLRGRSQTGVTNEGGYPKYLTAPCILSCYTLGEAALLSGFRETARPTIDSVPGSLYIRLVFYSVMLCKIYYKFCAIVCHTILLLSTL